MKKILTILGLVIVIGILLIVTKRKEQPVAQNTDGKSCYVYDHESSIYEPYEIHELLEIEKNGNQITGEKSGTQAGPDMTNGYTGTINGTIENEILDVAFTYIIEGSKNTEEELYRFRGSDLEKIRHPLEEKDGILVPDQSKTPIYLLYKKVDCLSNKTTK